MIGGPRSQNRRRAIEAAQPTLAHLSHAGVKPQGRDRTGVQGVAKGAYFEFGEDEKMAGGPMAYNHVIGDANGWCPVIA